jgi:hypothetical protein
MRCCYMASSFMKGDNITRGRSGVEPAGRGFPDRV